MAIATSSRNGVTKSGIVEFKGRNRFLSNFYLHPIIYEGVLYQSLEHAYQAAKTINPIQRAHVLAAKNCATAKKLGKIITLRQGWNDMKLGVMEELLRQKFSDPTLRTMLIQTGDQHLEEGNYWHDEFWGTYHGKGENHLGKLLMMIRDEQFTRNPSMASTRSLQDG